MKVFLTRYTLTTGEIEEYEVGDDTLMGRQVIVLKRPGLAPMAYLIGKDLYLTEHEAQMAASAAMLKEIGALQRKISKLTHLDIKTKRIQS